MLFCNRLGLWLNGSCGREEDRHHACAAGCFTRPAIAASGACQITHPALPHAATQEQSVCLLCHFGATSETPEFRDKYCLPVRQLITSAESFGVEADPPPGILYAVAKTWVLCL